MKRYLKYLPAFFLIGLFHICSAQDASEITLDSYSSEIYSYRKGLSQNTVQCIMQDSRGFIWLGTWDGLNRFDGYKFSIYRPDYYEPSGNISNETINALTEDINGNLWIGTDNGLNLYSYKTDTFKTFYYSFYNPDSPMSDSITALAADKYGIVWIGTNKGLCSYDILKEKFSRYYFNSLGSTISNANITALFIDSSNRLWVGTHEGIVLIDLKTRRISRLNLPNFICSEENPINTFAEYKNTILVGTNLGLHVVESETSEELYFNCANGFEINTFFSAKSINHIIVDKRNRIWFATPTNGVYIYSPGTCGFQHLYSDFSSRYGLINNDILSMATSSGGEVWIGTVHGLSIFSDFAYKFPHFRISEKQFDNSYNLVWAFQAVGSDNILIGTRGGLILFDLKYQQFSHFSKDDFGEIPVVSLKVINNENIWVGTAGNGVYLLDGRGRVKKNIKSGDVGGIAGNFVWDIIADSAGNIWLACGGGVSCINLKTLSCKNWLYPGYESKNSISSNIVFSLMIDKYGIVWVSTFNGLNRLDPKTGKIYVFHHDKGNPLSISNDRILSSFEDSEGIIWIGTFGGGLNKYDRRTGVFSRYTKKEGFPDNVIYNIVEDKSGNLWLTSNSGLIRFNSKDNVVAHYDVNDGIQSHEFNGGAAEILPNGKILVGGMNGFNFFDPKDIKINKKVPKLVITEFSIFNKPYGVYIEDGDTVILSPNNNFFSISFAALDYTNPSKNQYSYILSNYDKDWIHTDATKRKAEYTDVKPGTYKFIVKGTNNDGIWNEKGLSFTIIVKPPFYKTWLFRLAIISLALFLSWFFIRGRIKKVRQQNEVATKMLNIEKEMFDLEQKALRLQMNPHFIFNSLNSIQSYILSNDSENAINYLAKFSQLMRLILNTSREAYIPLSQEISLLKHYIDLENMRFNNRFLYEIRVESGMDTEYLGIPPMIIQPYIENAILHGFMNKKSGECRLLIQMWEEDKYILCIIEDNGIGREKAMEIKLKSGLMQKSQGIVITKERMDILNRQLKNKISVEITDLKDEQGKAVGTRVRLVIPYIDL